MKSPTSVRWIIWAILLTGMSVSTFHRVALAVVADQVMADFNLSAVAFGNLAALYFYVYAIMQIPSGILTDFLGPRKIVTWGLAIASVGSIIFGLSSVLSVVYLGRFLVSLGVAVIWVSILKFLSEWFLPQQFGTIMGLSATVGLMGSLLATTPLAILVNHTGWQDSFVLIGLATLVIAGASWLIIRDRPSDVELHHTIEVGKGRTERNSTSLPLESKAVSLTTKIRMVLTNKYTWPAFLIGMLYGPFVTFIGTWAVPYLMQVYNLSREAAANFAFVGTVGMLISCPAVGFISDRIMRRRRLPIVVFAVANLVAWTVLIFWNGGKPPLETLYPICFFMGLWGGAEILSHACVKEVNSPDVAGIAMGFTNTGVFLGPVVLQPLFGYMLDLHGIVVEGTRVYPLEAYQAGFMLCLLASAVITVGAFLLKETRCQNIWSPTKSRLS